MRDVLSVMEDWPEARDKVSYSALPYFDMRDVFSLYDAILVKGKIMIHLLYFAHLGWLDEARLMKDSLAWTGRGVEITSSFKEKYLYQFFNKVEITSYFKEKGMFNKINVA
ncbi:hypothetical protein ACJMK2_000216 [Sinanodonta woodiana]|uniref:Uncharacterized protein n=1 Tax=Sinanodonta woodiana TaxID=1069815 RepID=A0ABD3XQW7_SINWO